MIGPEVNQNLRDLTFTSSKSLQFLFNIEATMWVSLLMKWRDTAIALTPKFVPHKEQLDLRNSKFLGLDHLFPQERVIQAN